MLRGNPRQKASYAYFFLHFQYTDFASLNMRLTPAGLRERADVRSRRRRRLKVVRGDGHAPLLNHIGRRTRSSGMVRFGVLFTQPSLNFLRSERTAR